ncbi:hypothetical protein SY88_04110 [Clostridiales bacterium PH28_bin88]|nr:hypothetical protein SY88_04110 [Clostridiales bacterium PH28_bin88]
MSRVIKSATVDDLSTREIRVRKDLRFPEAPGDPLTTALLTRAEAEARRLLEDAAREAEAVVTSARVEAGALREAARRAGYDEGRLAGWDEGLRQAQSLKDEAGQVLESARLERAATLEGLEKEIVGLALAVAEKVVRRQVSVEQDIVLDIAREALRRAVDSHNVFLRVHPSLADMLQGKRDELERNLVEGASLQVVADSGISPGGCRVETEMGDVHATLEEQLGEIRDALLRETEP